MRQKGQFKKKKCVTSLERALFEDSCTATADIDNKARCLSSRSLVDQQLISRQASTEKLLDNDSCTAAADNIS